MYSDNEIFIRSKICLKFPLCTEMISSLNQYKMDVNTYNQHKISYIDAISYNEYNMTHF